MKTLENYISTAFLLLTFTTVQAKDQHCNPGDNYTLISTQTMRKPTLRFVEVFWHYPQSLLSRLVFGDSEMSTTCKTRCHPLTEELFALLVEEYQYSWMKINSEIQIFDDNPWWCKDFGKLNHPEQFDSENSPPSRHGLPYTGHGTPLIFIWKVDIPWPIS